MGTRRISRPLEKYGVPGTKTIGTHAGYPNRTEMEEHSPVVHPHNWTELKLQECGCLFRECYDCGAMEWDALECKHGKDSMGFPIHTSLVLE